MIVLRLSNENKIPTDFEILTFVLKQYNFCWKRIEKKI